MSQNGSVHEFPESSFLAEAAVPTQYAAIGLQGTKENYVEHKADGTAPLLGISQTAAEDTEADKSIVVKVSGFSKATVDMAVSIGDELTASTDGKLTPAGAGEYVIAIAMGAAAADGEIIEVQNRETYPKA